MLDVPQNLFRRSVEETLQTTQSVLSKRWKPIITGRSATSQTKEIITEKLISYTF
jgi:hypothetical protein